MLLQNDVSIELRKEVYKNIIKSGLHRAAVKTLILPCPDVIEWITRKSRSVASYKDSVFSQIYHLKEAHIKVTPEWLRQKNEVVDFLTIMKGWLSEGHFRAKYASVEWETSKFRKSVQIIVILLSKVLGRKDDSSFPNKWIPIIYQIITSGSTLN